jgi:hypothetical protein
MTPNKDDLPSEATAAACQCQLYNVMTDPFPGFPSQPSPELRIVMSALTSSWLMYEPPIIGVDPSIVVHQRRSYPSMMAFVPDPNLSSEHGHDLAGASLFLRMHSLG